MAPRLLLPCELRRHPHFLAYLALSSICLFWGTTYLAIRMALESFPPLLLVATRFILSGSLLLGACRLAKMPMPHRREFIRTAFNGVLILGVGNGCLTFSELWIPSSLAALFITISPFWMVGIEAGLPGGEPLHLPTIAGMLVGLTGAALLVGMDVLHEGFEGSIWKGFLLLQLGSASWSFGSIRQRREAAKAQAVVSGAVQQLAAGLAFLLPALFVREHPVAWSVRGVSALFYLVLFGSIVGYSSYIYALERLPVAIVSIYTYVNPVVAAFLGWLVYSEPFGRREAIAMAIIFLGVALVKRYTSPPLRPRA
jgi:drug/metabolite transporter (DMT)-like permease